jgi:phenylalanyl-tRNA synthetase alpha chain
VWETNLTLLDELRKLQKEAEGSIETSSSLEELKKVRVSYLGRKGKLTGMLRSLATLSAEERPTIGKEANLAQKRLEELLEQKAIAIEKQTVGARLAAEAIDITLPGKLPRFGRKHIITQTMEEIIDIFLGLGYEVVEGPEVELAYYNFDALNTPETHPSRSYSDTFYMEAGDMPHPSPQEVLLRTQTSPVQIREMEKRKPPLFVIAPGRVYRPDAPDATHTPMFHQIEGFAVDRGITFSDLKGTLETFAHSFFGPDRGTKFLPHFFPFTEPSAELMVDCGFCHGKGCPACSGEGWLEILGCGMVDPSLFEEVGYDPEDVTGFAFGLGVDRIAKLRHNISDMRVLFDNDLRFLEQF